jgi:peroxiredoxin Q/BCP
MPQAAFVRMARGVRAPLHNCPQEESKTVVAFVAGCYGAAVLAVGAQAPDFRAAATDGRELSLSELSGAPVVLYFFPKAFTPVCAHETARFRDNFAELSALGAHVLGVSPDPLETQCDFGRQQRVQFPLLADPDRLICSSYGVLWPLLPRARRVTFVLSEARRVELVLSHEFQVSKHLDGVLNHLRRRAGSSKPA